jgi:hypothetical protein
MTNNQAVRDWWIVPWLRSNYAKLKWESENGERNVYQVEGSRDQSRIGSDRGQTIGNAVEGRGVKRTGDIVAGEEESVI